METTLDLPAIEDQREFNLRRWREIFTDLTLTAPAFCPEFPKSVSS
jgi:hypothetical protein